MEEQLVVEVVRRLKEAESMLSARLVIPEFKQNLLAEIQKTILKVEPNYKFDWPVDEV